MTWTLQIPSPGPPERLAVATHGDHGRRRTRERPHRRRALRLLRILPRLLPDLLLLRDADARQVPLHVAGGGGTAAAFALVGGAFALAGLATGTSDVLQLSLRQMLTPDRLAGRTTATFRFVAYGSVPVGALTAGALGEALGLRPALWAMSGVLMLAPPAIVASPLRTYRQLPLEEPEYATTTR